MNLAGALLANHRDSVDLAVLYNSHSGNARHWNSPQPLPTRSRWAAIPGGFPPSQARSSVPICLSTDGWPFTQSAATTPSRAIYHATEHLLPNVAAPTVLTVHDLIFRRYRHHTLTNRAFLNLAVPLFARRADAIIIEPPHQL